MSLKLWNRYDDKEFEYHFSKWLAIFIFVFIVLNIWPNSVRLLWIKIICIPSPLIQFLQELSFIIQIKITNVVMFET